MKMSRTIYPQARKNSTILLIVDFPTIEDEENGILFSGMHKRTIAVHKIISRIGIDESEFSFASMCSCVTKSKSIILKQDYNYCASLFINKAIEDIKPKGIITFGVIAGEYLIGENISNIEATRGKVYSYRDIPVMITYSMSVLTDRGCGSCSGSNSRIHFIRKDIEKMLIHLKKEGKL